MSVAIERFGPNADNALSKEIVDCAFRVHKALGPGLLESAYEECLAIAFSQKGLSFKRQVPMPLTFEGIEIENAYRLDFIIQETFVLEIKSVEKLMPIHEAQLLTYLKLSGCTCGFLINFNTKLFKEGIKRYVF